MDGNKTDESTKMRFLIFRQNNWLKDIKTPRPAEKGEHSLWFCPSSYHLIMLWKIDQSIFGSTFCQWSMYFKNSWERHFPNFIQIMRPNLRTVIVWEYMNQGTYYFLFLDGFDYKQVISRWDLPATRTSCWTRYDFDAALSLSQSLSSNVW